MSESQIYGISLDTFEIKTALIDENGQSQVILNDEALESTQAIIGWEDPETPYIGMDAQFMNETSKISDSRPDDPKYITTNLNRRIPKEKIYELLLGKIVNDANQNREDEGLSAIDSAVISVPSDYTFEEKYLIMKGCESAGIKLREIIYDPIADAMAIGITHFGDRPTMLLKICADRCYLTILKSSGKELHIVQTSSDTQISSERILQEFFDNLIMQELGLTPNTNNEETMSERIKSRCEQAFNRLIRDDRTLINLALHQYKTSLLKRIDRSDFSQLTKKSTETLRAFLRQKSSGYSEDIKEIILIGKYSCLPTVRELCSEIIPGVEIRLITSDTNTAIGTAMYAHNLVTHTSTPKLI